MNYMRHMYLIFFPFLGLLIPAASHAITIEVPQTISANQPATIIITARPTSVQDDGCFLNIDFGDRTAPGTALLECSGTSAPCTVSVTHIFQRAGTYTLRAYSSGCATGAFMTDPAIKTISVVDLKIKRMDLFFDNRLPKMTVTQYQRNLKAVVEINYTGSGLLQGYWEVDGRLFSRINKQLYRGAQKATIPTPIAPPLHTHAVGSHTIRFVVTRPGAGIAFPQAVYFVEAPAKKDQLSIQLFTPADGKSISCAPIDFRWRVSGKAYVFLVEFVEADSTEPSFAAYAKEGTYTLKEEACRSLSRSGRSYRWRVKALSQEGQIIGQSDAFNLSIVSGTKP